MTVQERWSAILGRISVFGECGACNQGNCAVGIYDDLNTTGPTVPICEPCEKQILSALLGIYGITRPVHADDFPPDHPALVYRSEDIDDLPPEATIPGQVVYLMEQQEPGQLAKVGMTSNVQRRWASLNGPSPYPLQVIHQQQCASAEAARWVEAEAKRTIPRSPGLRSEWFFKIHVPLAIEVITEAHAEWVRENGIRSS